MISLIGITFIILSAIFIIFKQNKKVLITIVLSIFSVAIVFCVVIVINHKTTNSYTLEEITGVKFDDIYKVTIDYDRENNNVKYDFLNKYQNASFRKEKYIDEIIKEKILKKHFNGTAKIYSYICYDNNENIIYNFSPRGGSLDICKIKIGEEEIEVYQINGRKK